MNTNELIDKLQKVGWNKPFTSWELLDEAATMLRQQQAEIEQYEKSTDYWMKLCQEADAENEALKEDGKRLDWIWKQASKISGGGVFQIKGIELFTVVTQHIINTKGIRELLDSAMEIDAREKASKR